MGIVESCSLRDPREKANMKPLGKEFLATPEKDETAELYEALALSINRSAKL